MKIVLIFLVIALSAINGQDVKGRIACEKNSFTLTCGKGEYLEIVGGNYGRTSGDVCKYQKNNNCVSQWSLSHMKEKCNNRQTCYLSATNSEMGDPCPYTIKYLETYYKCVKEVQCNDTQYKCNNKVCIPKSKVCDGLKDCAGGEDEAGCKYTKVTACEQTRLTINCQPNEIIRVVRGFYGRTSKTTCGNSDVINCSSSKANDVIKYKCNYQQSCTMLVTSNEFGDPCAGVSKYAEVEYSCWSVPKMMPRVFNN